MFLLKKTQKATLKELPLTTRMIALYETSNWPNFKLYCGTGTQNLAKKMNLQLVQAGQLKKMIRREQDRTLVV
jgi:hypothetical protein